MSTLIIWSLSEPQVFRVDSLAEAKQMGTFYGMALSAGKATYIPRNVTALGTLTVGEIKYCPKRQIEGSTNWYTWKELGAVDFYIDGAQ